MEGVALAKRKTPTVYDLAKRGDFAAFQRAVTTDVDVGRVFERAVTDFRTVRRNDGHGRILDWCIESGLDPMMRISWFNVPAVVLAAHFGNSHVAARLRDGATDPGVYAALGRRQMLDHWRGENEPASWIDSNGFNLLHYCAMSGLGRENESVDAQLAAICADLVADGVDAGLTVPDALPLSPAFLCAAAGGSVNVLLQLIDAGGVSESNYHLVVEHALEPHQRSGDPASDLAQAVLDAGYDVNALRADQGRTLLHGSANRGSVAPVEWLLDAGADVNVVDTEGRTPLHVAAIRNTGTKVVELLLARGADPGARDASGATALDLAHANERTRVADALSRSTRR